MTLVLVTCEDAVATVTPNRPEAMNAPLRVPPRILYAEPRGPGQDRKAYANRGKAL